jgi:bifunctional DNA-binding transcriptional regulator/antitoxin component of YhaV-PrlF toxin-antitoxin module
MKTTIDREGRITLGKEVQTNLGVQPGDDVLLEQRGAELVIRAAKPQSGLSLEGNVLVHRGTCVASTDPLTIDRDERFDQLTEGLPK